MDTIPRQPKQFLVWLLFALAFLSLCSSASVQIKSQAPSRAAQAPFSCCLITSIDASTGVVTAKVNATGQAFQFKVTDATVLRSLKIGQGVYANLKTQQVSVDGKTLCCQIISVGPMTQGAAPQSAQLGPASPSTPHPPTAAPPGACCAITGINAPAQLATAKVNSSGQTFEFKVSDAALLNSLKIGQAIFANFKAKQVSLDGKAVCCEIVSLNNATTGPTPQPSAPSAPTSTASPTGSRPQEAAYRQVDPCTIASPASLQALLQSGIQGYFPVAVDNGGEHIRITNPTVEQVTCPHMVMKAHTDFGYSQTQGFPQFSIGGSMELQSSVIVNVTFSGGVLTAETATITAGNFVRAIAVLSNPQVTSVQIQNVPSWVDTTFVTDCLNGKYSNLGCRDVLHAMSFDVTNLMKLYLEQGHTIPANTTSGATATRSQLPTVATGGKLAASPAQGRPTATPSSGANPACCAITAINAATGVVTAKATATGQSFQFKANPQQLSALKVGQGVFANLKTKQVSLNGTQPCCQIVSLIPGAIFQLPNFQKCCTMLNNWPRVLGTGPVEAEASVPGNSLPIIFYDLPSFDAQYGGLPGSLACVNTQAGQPIYVDFSQNLVSQDGKTPCGYLAAAVETDYLDLVPVGIVYVPPGDPKAGLTGGTAPSQTFASLNQAQTTTTTTTVTISGQSIKVSISGPLTITAQGSQTTSSTTQDQQQNILSFLSQAPPATGGAGYPGTNDEFVFFLNPTYDVQYSTGYNVSDPSHPYPRKIWAVTPHSAQPYEPGPQWELIMAPVGEIVSLTGNGKFLAQDLLAAPPQVPVPMDPPSGSIVCLPPSKGGNFSLTSTYGSPAKPLTPLQSVVRRLLALDPMLYSTNPSCVPEHPERFTPITMFQDADGQQYTPGTSPIPWTYCQVPGPVGFTNTVAQTNTTITSTQNKFTSGVTMNFNPVQALAMATGAKFDGVGASFEFGSTWEVDTTIQNQWQNGFQLTSKGQFGSGTAPYVNGSCPANVPGFRTQLYYDWQNLSVLFWTQQAF